MRQRGAGPSPGTGPPEPPEPPAVLRNRATRTAAPPPGRVAALAKRINRGYKVAICEQMTKPGETKGMLQREVGRLVTPGTVVEPGLLDSKSNNYLVSVVPGEGEAGLAE